MEQPEIDEATGELVWSRSIQPCTPTRSGSGHPSSCATRTVISTGSKVGLGTLGGSPHVLDVPLGDREAQPTPSFAYPLELLAIEIELTPPRGTPGHRGDRRRCIASRRWPARRYRRCRSPSRRGWRTTASVYGLPQVPVEARNAGEELVVETGTTGLQTIRGVDPIRPRDRRDVRSRRARRASAPSRSPSSPPMRYLEATGPRGRRRAAGCGSPVSIGRSASTGAIRAFPTVDPSRPVILMDYQTLALCASRAAPPSARRRNGGSRSTRRTTRRPSIAFVTRRSAAARS